jgi:lipoprotein-anchoring transpeptidase ErfK/SrfK
LRGFRLYWVDGGNTPWPRQRSAWCGVGRRGRASWSLTPRGTFRVVEREDLTRRKADSKYGTRILVLDTRIGAGRRISIHGTNEPLLIGTRVSDGCVRLFNEDIEWLYDRVPVGTTVVIGD